MHVCCWYILVSTNIFYLPLYLHCLRVHINIKLNFRQEVDPGIKWPLSALYMDEATDATPHDRMYTMLICNNMLILCTRCIQNYANYVYKVTSTQVYVKVIWYRINVTRSRDARTLLVRNAMYKLSLQRRPWTLI